MLVQIVRKVNYFVAFSLFRYAFGYADSPDYYFKIVYF